MHQPGGKATTSSDAGIKANVLDPKRNRNRRDDAPRFNQWIDPSSDAIADTEVSRLVSEQSNKKLGSGNGGVSNNNRNKGGFCRISTSSGYSSQQRSPPLSGGDGSCYPDCCANPGTLVAKDTANGGQSQSRLGEKSTTYTVTLGAASSQNLAVIQEGETIPRPVWPYMGEDFRDEQPAASTAGYALRYGVETANDRRPGHDTYAATNVAYEACTCNYCRRLGNKDEPRNYGEECRSENCGRSAKQVLLELSRTLNSVIDASESDNELNAEEILRDISITVARGIKGNEGQSKVEDYGCRLSSSSSSGAGKESLVGVNPVNLRVYGKPKWLHVPVSSTRSSSQCPYEAKTLLTAVSKKATRATPALSAGNTGAARVPAIFLVPHGNSVYPDIGDVNEQAKLAVCKADGTARNENCGAGRYESTAANKRTIPNSIGRSQGRNSENCAEKCPSGEPVYSTQLDGSDESSSYGAIGDSPAANNNKSNVWNGSSKVFDPHLDFTLDGNRAERLGRVIAKAKRKRQWCRGVTAILGLVFFVLSVVIVSLSVTRGRKVFGSM